MAQIKLLRKSTAYENKAGSYRMTLEVFATEDITKNVFIKQRLRNFVKNNFDDVFVAIATPAQLEDFDESSPAEGSSYYRTSSIDLISRNIGYLEDVFQSILAELQKLVDDYDSLNLLQPDGIYTITSESIHVSSGIIHAHYRLPLIARPCGTNEIYEEDDVNKHRVGSQDANLSGWLNTTGADPNGYKFKYNIAKDTALHAIWPPTADKLSYAHLELEGVTNNDVLITTDGIYWKDDLEGLAPWPIDYVNVNNPSPSGEKVRLTLDIII